jgi:hypothetical protein
MTNQIISTLPHVLLGHVDLSFGKDVHPIALFQLFDAQIDGRLMDSVASHDRYALAVVGECCVAVIGEEDVVGGQGPAHRSHVAGQAYGKDTCN